MLLRVMSSRPTALFLVLLCAGSALAQDGTIGVYADAAGTQPCITAPIGMTTLYVLATLQGRTAGGITGAEYRLEFSSLAGYLGAFFTSVPCACIFIGSPIDTTDCDRGTAGSSFAFPTCQTSDPLAGPGRVRLGTVSILHFGSGAPIEIVTRRRMPSSDPARECPLLWLCDAPVFTAVCLTPQDGDPILGGLEPENFSALVNAPGCVPPPRCIPLATGLRAWSRVKELYR